MSIRKQSLLRRLNKSHDFSSNVTFYWLNIKPNNWSESLATHHKGGHQSLSEADGSQILNNHFPERIHKYIFKWTMYIRDHVHLDDYNKVCRALERVGDGKLLLQGQFIRFGSIVINNNFQQPPSILSVGSTSLM